MMRRLQVKLPVLSRATVRCTAGCAHASHDSLHQPQKALVMHGHPSARLARTAAVLGPNWHAYSRLTLSAKAMAPEADDSLNSNEVDVIVEGNPLDGDR